MSDTEQELRALLSPPRLTPPRPALHPAPSRPVTCLPSPFLSAPCRHAPPSDTYAFAKLLHRELFGIDFDDTSPMTPIKNIFMYGIEHPSPESPAKNMFMQNGFSGRVAWEVSVPVNVPRTVAKTPHKVLDALSLQDDFYLNLVDWSSQNNDGVCAVQWMREG